ncbi:hypothetical protein VTL71DRAFT_7363 [Oculimacula yallundae]|uniref:Xylanolytic transcriptional activator regulatory domain-containing protein n=1 Tax=Oculimacula yallundae TaxID=86028 RepID=A0ABR4BWG9_9HELO
MPQVAVVREWIVQSEPQQADSGLRETNNGRNAAPTSIQSPGSLSTIGKVGNEAGQIQQRRDMYHYAGDELGQPRRPDVSQPPMESPAARSQDLGISPAQQPFEITFNTDAQTNRVKMMGGSSSQCLMKTLDIYLESAQSQPLSHNFRHGMRHAEELNIKLGAALPNLPDASLCSKYVSVFFDKIHPIYPMFDIDQMKSIIQQFANMPSVYSVSHEQGPLLVSAYLILSLGADEGSQAITSDGTKYLEAAASLLGHVLAMPYLHAIQALLLFTIAYRGRNSDGLGWQTVGMAIRIAYTLGLHRHSYNNPSAQHAIQNKSDRLFHARIWAICCSLEKMMQLESGRPATIVNVDRDHMIGPEQRAPGQDFLQWHMGLAQHQGLICHHIYGHKPGERTAQEILSDTGRLDRSLLSWAREIPEEFRPGNDLFCQNDEFHIAALISIQYYQALIALHRAALIAPVATFKSEVAKHTFDPSFKLRLLAGEAICVSSARSIARLTIELADRNVQSRIMTAGPPLMACIVLSISIIKNAGNRSMTSDLELLKVCVEYTADQFTKTGHNNLFVKGVLTIHQQVRAYIDRLTHADQIRKAEPPSTLDKDGITSPAQVPPESPSMGQQLRDSGPYNHGPTQSTQVLEPAIISISENLPPRNSIMGLDMTVPAMESYTPRLHSNGELPFDNLDVQELWDWMGNLSDYDNYSYQGSY